MANADFYARGRMGDGKELKARRELCKAYGCERTDTTLHVVNLGAAQEGRSMRLCPRHQEGYEVPTAPSAEGLPLIDSVSSEDDV